MAKVGRTKLEGHLRNVECVRIAKYSYLSVSLSTQHDNPLEHQNAPPTVSTRKRF
jgi:hypothetical protein